MKRQTLAQIEKGLIGLGLEAVELPANATQQTKKFVDSKSGIAYLSFKNGHVARTVEGASGKRFSLNPIKEGERVMLMTEAGRLNRISEYVQAHKEVKAKSAKKTRKSRKSAKAAK